MKVAQHDAKTRAGAAATRAGDLYERCADDWRTITLDELRMAEWLRDGDPWVSPTLAEQTIARLPERQGRAHGVKRVASR